MAKATKTPQNELGELEQAIERAADYARRGGLKKARFIFERDRIDAKAIREELGMSRQDFAMQFGLSLRTIQNWEAGRREPEGPAKALLIVIMHEPDAVRRAVARYRSTELPPGQTRSKAAAHHSAGLNAIDPIDQPMNEQLEPEAEMVLENALREVRKLLLGQIVNQIPVDLGPYMRLFDAAKEVIEHPSKKKVLHQLGEAVAELEPSSKRLQV